MTTEEVPAGKNTAGWLGRSFQLLWKALTVMAFIMYIGGGAAATAALAQKKIYKAEPITEIYKYINEEEDNGRFAELLIWLGARPLGETDRIIEMLSPKSQGVSPAIFFEIFRRELKLNRPEEALFWLQLGRFRLWYDLIRCENGDEGAKAFDKALQIFTVEEMEGLLQQHPELLQKSLRRVLDFDAKYPADDDPAQICKIIGPQPPVPPLMWSAYRASLRRKTAASIRKMEEIPVAPAVTPATDSVKKPDGKKTCCGTGSGKKP